MITTRAPDGANNRATNGESFTSDIQHQSCDIINPLWSRCLTVSPTRLGSVFQNQGDATENPKKNGEILRSLGFSLRIWLLIVEKRNGKEESAGNPSPQIRSTNTQYFHQNILISATIVSDMFQCAWFIDMGNLNIKPLTMALKGQQKWTIKILLLLIPYTLYVYQSYWSTIRAKMANYQLRKQNWTNCLRGRF